VKLIRPQLPEVVVLVLLERGQQTVPSARQVSSPSGRTTLGGTWPVVQLWEVPAAPLLAGGDVGGLRLAAMRRLDAPSAVVGQQVKDRIEAEAPPAEVENLIAVTQVMATARFTDLTLLNILGGRQRMLISPVVQEIVAEAAQQTSHRL